MRRQTRRPLLTYLLTPLGQSRHLIFLHNNVNQALHTLMERVEFQVFSGIGSIAEMDTSF